jgi:hypothetical protein
VRDPGVYWLKGGRGLREAGAIDFSAQSEQLDGADIRLEQLAQMADALLEQVSDVRDQYERLERALGNELPEPAETVGGARPVHDHDDHERAKASGIPVHDSARLVVMEMAVSGSTREETKQYLREALDVDGGDPIVDEVFDRTEAAQEAAPLHRRLFTRRRD